MASLAGFKKVDGIPPKLPAKKGSKYDQLIQTVEDTGNVYCLDLRNKDKAKTVTAAVRARAQKLSAHIKVCLRGTVVYVMRRDDND